MNNQIKVQKPRGTIGKSMKLAIAVFPALISCSLHITKPTDGIITRPQAGEKRISNRGVDHADTEWQTFLTTFKEAGPPAAVAANLPKNRQLEGEQKRERTGLDQ